MNIPIRLDEHEKTSLQKAQRESTYAAAQVLRAAGFRCEVREFFTGSSETADAAGIFLTLEEQ